MCWTHGWKLTRRCCRVGRVVDLEGFHVALGDLTFADILRAGRMMRCPFGKILRIDSQVLGGGFRREGLGVCASEVLEIDSEETLFLGGRPRPLVISGC